MGAGVLPGGKVAGAWCWSLQPTAGFKNEWCYTSLRHKLSSLAWGHLCLCLTLCL